MLAFQQRSVKPVMPFSSNQSKTVRRGVFKAAVLSSFSRSCYHEMEAGFRSQLGRFQNAGFPDHLLHSVCLSILKRSCKGKECVKEQYKGAVVIPYIHGVSHRLKKLAQKHGVQVVFGGNLKLGSLPVVVNKTEGDKLGRQIKHKDRFLDCSALCVYDIPLSCGRAYIGQTCVKIRLRDHQYRLKTKEGTLSEHIRYCGCMAEFSDTTVKGRFKQPRERGIWDAFLIGKKGDKCVSCPSIGLLNVERDFLSLYVCSAPVD